MNLVICFLIGLGLGALFCGIIYAAIKADMLYFATSFPALSMVIIMIFVDDKYGFLGVVSYAFGYLLGMIFYFIFFVKPVANKL